MRGTKSLFLGVVLLPLALASAVHARGPLEPPESGSNYAIFPRSDEVFHKLLADPREIQSALRFYRGQGENLSDVALGNSWGLMRWWYGGWIFQWAVEGMAYSRFRLTGGVNEFQTIDFFANLPLEMRRGRFSSRFMLYHESSHLGDDYIRRTHDTGFRYSLHGAKLIVSYDLHEQVRLYGGGAWNFHNVPHENNGSLQAGFELRTRDLKWIPGHDCWGYLANDFRWHDKTRMHLSTKTELGLRLGVPRIVRTMRVGVSYQGGHSEYGQFFRDREDYWDLGLSFDF